MERIAQKQREEEQARLAAKAERERLKAAEQEVVA
jgi:Na+-translocating ferredoxin:NAD+ oxidoreductase subunit C